MNLSDGDAIVAVARGGETDDDDDSDDIEVTDGAVEVIDADAEVSVVEGSEAAPADADEE
jgi:hypothetical protein